MPAAPPLRWFLYTGLLAVACGRSGLDLGPPSDIPIVTGAAGTVASTGTGGDVGAAGGAATGPGMGAGGDVAPAGTTGSGGTGVGTGAAGAGVTGFAGGTGAAGAGGAFAAGGAAGTAKGLAGAGGLPGGTGSAGATGAAGAAAPPPGIPCGNGLCVAGAQTCCIQLVNGAPRPSCIGAGEACDMGVSIGCSSTAQCGGGGDVCCATAAMLSTSCQAPAMCLASTGVVLCGADADCPGALPNCCTVGTLGVCRARACSRGGRGGGGGAGPGRGGGGGGPPAPPGGSAPPSPAAPPGGGAPPAPPGG